MNCKINNNESNDRNDWRFTDQDMYLLNKKFYYSSFCTSRREHDHCEFCWEEFSCEKDGLHFGYCDESKYYWICEKCYKDFLPLFGWKIKK